MLGSKFGMLTIVEKTDRYEGSHRQWKCSCDCGGEVLEGLYRLRHGLRRSCGCLRGAPTHKESIVGEKTPEYRTWAAMKSRCLNAKNKSFPRYGGRGITVCADWVEYENFLRDMGRRPSLSHSLERIDNDRGYSRENCRWATQLEQCFNRSNTVRIEVSGKTKALSQWAKDIGVDRTTIKNRAKYFGGDLSAAVKFYIERGAA